MPTTRSMRSNSKPSGSKKKKQEEEEMPPPSPPPTPPPKTKIRSTRTTKTTKKVSKPAPEPVEEKIEAPPIPSTSTRSTRSRARPTKASAPPSVSPAPPPARPTRSTRQKVTKLYKAITEPEDNDDSSDRETDEAKQEELAPPSNSKAGTSRTTAKKTAAKAKPKRKGKAASKAQVSLEPMSDPDMSTADEDSRQIKTLEPQELHKFHATTVKTAFSLSVCEVVPKYMQKIMDPDAKNKQEKEFQELLNAPEVEMPPPPPPQGKTKRRVKRARSPEPVPATTAVPKSFAFTSESEGSHTPAKKRLMVEVEIPPPKPVEETAPVPSASSTAEDKVVENIASTTEAADLKLDTEEEKDTATKSTEKPKLKAKKKLETNAKQKKPKTKGKVKQKELEKEESLEVNPPAPKENLAELSNKKPADEDKTKTNEEAANPAPPPPHKNGNEGKAVLENEAESNDDFLEQSIMEVCQTDDVGIPPTGAKAAVEIEDGDRVNVGEPEPVLANDKKSSLLKEQKEKNSELLNGTYVLETPKDARKVKELKQNTEYTPELFQDTPKADVTFDIPKTKTKVANQTVTISSDIDDEMDKKNDDTSSSNAQAVECEENEDTTNKAGNNGSGFVSTLVSFFSKTKTDTTPTRDEAKLPPTAADVPSKSRSPSPDVVDPDKPLDTDTGKKNMNSTFVLPAVKSPKADKKKQKPSSLLNVTVFVKDGPSALLDGVMDQQKPVPIIPPPKFYQQKNQSGPLKDNPCSRSFLKEPSGLDVVVEEDDDGASSTSSGKPSTGKKLPEKVKPVVSKQVPKEKELKKGTSSSSSASSTSSLKSASSQPCLLSSSSKKAPIASNKGPSYGSTGKLHEVYKSKPLEDAEKRRQDIQKQTADKHKKKNEEWKKKAEKTKLDEEKKAKEKQKFVHPSTSSGILKKPAPILNPPKPGFMKPKFNFGAGPSGSKPPTGNFVPPLSKQPFHVKPPPPPPVEEVEMDESFKSASSSNSFLDATVDGPLSSYDITRYEDLDDDLKHRENKTVPTWASDKESLKVALFSMVYLPEYQQSLHLTFPKPDRSYKLFPPRMMYN